MQYVQRIGLLNDNFVEKFAALNIVLEPSDIDRWFQNDGPGYEHLDTQGIVDLVIAPAKEIQDEEDADENVELSNQKKDVQFLTQKPCKCLMIA